MKINVLSKNKGNMDEIESYLLRNQSFMAPSLLLHLNILRISCLFNLQI